MLGRRSADRSWGFRAARALSYTFNPLAFSPLTVAAVEAHVGAPPARLATTLGVAAVFYCLAPLAMTLWMVRTGRAESLEVRDRAARMAPMLVAVGAYAVGAAVLWATTAGPARPVVLAFALGFPLNTLVLAAITRHWKISLHLSSLAGLLAVLGFSVLTLPGTLGLADVARLALLVPLLMWARVRSHAHTPAQVVAGAAFGAAVVWAELAWLAPRLAG